ncbi:MAG: hypothetical protein V3V45_07360, partial [Candidatus Brocadiales bacterium]
QLYKFWANTPVIASFASDLLDKEYTFGYPVYYLLCEMDKKFPPRKQHSEFLNEIRPRLAMARELFFKNPTNEPPSWLHEIINKVILTLPQ